MIRDKRKINQIILIGLLICIALCTLPVMAISTTTGSAEIIALDKNIIEIHYAVDAVDTVYDVTGRLYYTGETKSICEFDIPSTDGLYVDTPENMKLDITKPLSVDIVVHNEMGATGGKSMGDTNAKPARISTLSVNKAQIPVLSDITTQSEKVKWKEGKFTHAVQKMELNKTALTKINAEQTPDQMGEIII